MSCKGRCDSPVFRRTHNIKGLGGSKSSYSEGWKKCTLCEISVFTIALYCPCCDYRLRSTPRSAKARKMLVEVRSDLKKT